MDNPFNLPTELPLVAIRGARAGYLQLAQTGTAQQYDALTPALFEAARDWAATLERLGAKRVYWITLSEVVRHLHIHLYPRWEEDMFKGIPLFEARETLPQPGWSPTLESALTDWASRHSVFIPSVL